MSENLCVHCMISGRVQGVWFRDSTQKQARILGLTGWVRNLPDGRVELLACGAKEKIVELHAWLKDGPPLASVSEVSYEELAWEDYEQFEIL